MHCAAVFKIQYGLNAGGGFFDTSSPTVDFWRAAQAKIGVCGADSRRV